MKVALLFLASIVIFSASACRVGEFLNGLAQGFNLTDLAPVYENCNAKDRALADAVLNLTHAVRNPANPDAFATAIENVGHALAEAVRACAKSTATTEGLIQKAINQIKEVNKTALFNNVLDNVPVIYNKLKTIVADIQNNPFNAGKNIAQLVSDILNGKKTVAAFALRRQLFGVPNNVVGDIMDIATDLFHGLQVEEGFLQTANTTINATDVVTLIADIGILGSDYLDVLNAIRDRNVDEIEAKFKVILERAIHVYGSYEVLRRQVIAGLERDLPLFENKERLENGVNALFIHFNEVRQLAEEIRTLTENKDFFHAGNALGKLYNIFYGGLIE